MPKSTQNGGVYLICNLRRCEFCLIILTSFFFSSYRDTVMFDRIKCTPPVVSRLFDLSLRMSFSLWSTRMVARCMILK